MKPPHEDRREQALSFIASRGVAGGTWKELSSATGMHHGSASSALSILHKAGRISRLADIESKRDGCLPYVLPDLIGGRLTRPHGRGPGRSDQALIDEGWQTGYDAAMELVGERPDLDTIRAQAHLDGFGQGRTHEAAATLRLVQELRRAIKGQHRVYSHTRSCWLDHPDCALQAVEKALLKTVPAPRRKEPAA